ncbi:hypothetical protein [Carnobacterium jeotgali]
MSKDMKKRLLRLERKTNTGDLPPLFIDILGNGMVEVYSDVDGKKEQMTEQEYEDWSKRMQHTDSAVFIDDITANID